jgi:hypothetical protein
MMAILIGQGGVPFQWREFWTVEAVIAILGTVFLLFLTACLLIWLRSRKYHLLHEEQMLALEKGLLRPGGASFDGGRRTGWTWVAVGVPFLALLAAVVATIGIVTWYGANPHLPNGHIPMLLITFWSVGGVVSVAALVIGGLGLMSVQRLRKQEQAAAPAAPPPEGAMFARVTEPGPGPEKMLRTREEP